MCSQSTKGGVVSRTLLILATALLFALGLAAAGCGGGDDESEEPAAADTEPAAEDDSGDDGDQEGVEGIDNELQLAADPGGGLSFDKTSLETEEGDISIVLTNESDTPHNVSIEGNGVDVEGETFQGGGTRTTTADLEPGDYVFYCSVPGHREGGMEGTLTVSAR
jgi:plastocyanin